MIEDKNMSKEQLLDELSKLRQRVSELERSETDIKGSGEEALEESKQRFKTLFERHHAVMLLIEPDSGKIIDANHAASQFYGYTRDQLSSMNIADINQLNPSEIAEQRKRAEREEYNYFVFPHRLATGEVRTVEVHSTPIDVQGQLLLFSIIHDITDRKKAEMELQHYQEHLEELVKERTAELDAKNKLLTQEVAERKQAEEAMEKYSHDLGERVKELSCLHSISELVRRNDISQEKILQELASILSKAYQFPEITACCITWGNNEYSTANFRKTTWSQNRTIMVHGEQAGTIEVCYLKERQEEYEGPFLAEERQLLNTVGDLLGRSTERKQAEEEREKLIVELQEALNKVKTLSGLLPICASCKKIRNDEGYWEQIELYIRDHSEAEFSHSICPECAEKLYPEYYKKK
ncbi:MAG: PAS domain S-box protein [Proteobacteria bacterium]|nr:PAS domain S-box protein [Pseudomonadota bacterium]